MKVIALERGLEELKDSLERYGYQTVFADEITGWISAYIYQEENALAQPALHSTLNNSLSSAASLDNSGVLLIQARDKTPEQIIHMIENRIYSPLFYN